MIVTELWALFAEYGEKFRPSWYSTQATHWPHLRPFFGATQVVKLTHGQVDDYRAYRRTCLTVRGEYTKASTRNREIHSLTAMCKWGVKRRHLSVHPLLFPDLEKEYPQVRGYLSEAGLASLLLALPPGIDRQVTTALYDSGLRLGELLALEARHVRHEGGKPSALSLDAGSTKNGTARIVPLTNRAAAAVAWGLQRGQRYVFGTEGWKYHDDTFRDHFVRARDAAGLPDNIVPHSCRHSCATNLRRRGVDWHLVKTILGHLTETAARTYQHVDGREYGQVRLQMEAGISEEVRATGVVGHPCVVAGGRV